MKKVNVMCSITSKDLRSENIVFRFFFCHFGQIGVQYTIISSLPDSSYILDKCFLDL